MECPTPIIFRPLKPPEPTRTAHARQGTAVVAWGELSDRPNTWIDRDGTPQATSVINGTRIIPNQLVNQRRANRQQSNSTSLPQYANAVPEQDPWAGQQAQA